MKVLKALGADIEARNNNGSTALMAAIGRNVEVLEELLEMGSDVEAMNDKGLPHCNMPWKLRMKRV